MDAALEMERHQPSELNKAIAKSVNKEGSCRMHTEFSHQISAVIVHSLGAYAQALRNAIIGQTARNTLQNLDLASRKTFSPTFMFEILFDTNSRGFSSGSHVAKTIAKFFNRSRFEKNTGSAGRSQLLKRLYRGTSCYNSNFRVRAPAPRFYENFKAGGAGHDQIKNSTIWCKPLDLRNGFYTILRNASHIETIHRFNQGTCSIQG
jgi:hypothetical protein